MGFCQMDIIRYVMYDNAMPLFVYSYVLYVLCNVKCDVVCS